MADETKDGPASEPAGSEASAVTAATAKSEQPAAATSSSPAGPTITDGARAEAGASKTDAAVPPERHAAATSDTFKATPSATPAAESPAVAGGTNAPQVPPPAGAPAAVPAPKPAPAAVAAAAKATATPAAATTGAAPAPPAPKAAAARPADAMSRRGFFSWAAVAWVGFTAAIGGCVTAMGRFMFPNVLFEPPTTFKAGFPRDFGEGVVDTRFVDKYGVWIIKDGGRIYSLIAICTHLGCPPAWLETQNKFKCPCHGSGYYKSGINFEGPTPRPLERARIYISPDDGQIVVDKSQKFQWELGQWDDPSSYIKAA
jgi:cytochrome b6-f complex iron-sulfur subunit